MESTVDQQNPRLRPDCCGCRNALAPGFSAPRYSTPGAGVESGCHRELVNPPSSPPGEMLALASIGSSMERFIAGLVKDFECGKLDRREFCQTVALAAAVYGAGDGARRPIGGACLCEAASAPVESRAAMPASPALPRQPPPG
jgi:hypothetical protein